MNDEVRPGKGKDEWKAAGKSVFSGRNCIGIFDTDNASDVEMIRRARLAAAAPDLLEALKDAHDALISASEFISAKYGSTNPARKAAINAAVAAIAKA